MSKDKVQANLEQFFGKSIKELSEMDMDEERRFVEERTGKPLRFPKTVDRRRSGCGNPLITRRRIRTLEEVDKRISKL